LLANYSVFNDKLALHMGENLQVVLRALLAWLIVI